MRRGALAIALLVALGAAATALAELDQSGNLFVHFGGGITPRDLPRSRPAPIGVRIEARSGSPPVTNHPLCAGSESL